MAKYKIVSRDAQINQSGEAKKFGDVIELSIAQASSLKGAIEPVDDEAQEDFAAIKSGNIQDAVNLKSMRGHERAEVLLKRKESIEQELARVNKQLSELSAAAPAKKPEKVQPHEENT